MADKYRGEKIRANIVERLKKRRAKQVKEQMARSRPVPMPQPPKPPKGATKPVPMPSPPKGGSKPVPMPSAPGSGRINSSKSYK